jgi:hypothetical protein
MFTLLGSTQQGTIQCPMVEEKEVHDAYKSELIDLYGAVVMIHLL